MPIRVLAAATAEDQLRRNPSPPANYQGADGPGRRTPERHLAIARRGVDLRGDRWRRVVVQTEGADSDIACHVPAAPPDDHTCPIGPPIGSAAARPHPRNRILPVEAEADRMVEPAS